LTEVGLRPRRVGVLLGIAAVAFTLDLITKVIVVARLEGQEAIELPGGLLRFQVTRNSGAAFSIGSGLTLLFTLIATGVVIYILRTARRLRSVPWAVTLGLLLGGATGNLVDRLLRGPAPLQGHVVDWIELPPWPVFNLADSSIVCGGVIAVWLAARGIQIDGTRTHDGDEPARAAAGDDGKGALDPDGSAGRDAQDGSRDPGRSTGRDAQAGARGRRPGGLATSAKAGDEGEASGTDKTGEVDGSASAPGRQGAEKS
jgi:signal peptidase II